MKIDSTLLDTLTAQAKANPHLRQAYDLRTTSEDNSQRILNAMEPGTILPIRRHRGSTETVVVLRGKIRQNFYDEAGQLVESIIVAPCADVMGFSVEVGRWHNTECLESGTVILECKDGKPFDMLRNNEALGEEDIMSLDSRRKLERIHRGTLDIRSGASSFPQQAHQPALESEIHPQENQ